MMKIVLLALAPSMTLGQTLTAAGFVPYLGYNGTLAVMGTIGPMTTEGTNQTFEYILTGVDSACFGGANLSAANSCGIHIHVGTSCSSNAGMHYFTGAVTTDPWTAIAYTAVADAVTGTQTSGTYTLNTGAGSGDIAGRSVIIHDYVGGRIACALLGAVTVVPPNTPPSSPPMNTPTSSPPPTIKDCFPSSATVMLASGTERSLGALQLGDEIVVSCARPACKCS